MALVFESRSTDLYLDKFEWPEMVNKNGMFGGGGMYLSPQSPAEMSFMAEELSGIPEWIDLSWQSPLMPSRPADTFESQFEVAKRYEQRVYPAKVIPESAVKEVHGARGKILKLHFVFDDAKAWLEYEVHKWR